MERKENKNIDIEELTLFYLFAILRRQCVLFFSIIRLVGCILIAYIQILPRVCIQNVLVCIYVCGIFNVHCMCFLSICFPKYGSKLNKLYLCVSEKRRICGVANDTFNMCTIIIQVYQVEKPNKNIDTQTDY